MTQFYDKEIMALKHAGRYRARQLYAHDVVDLASNDYLGLAENSLLMEKACRELAKAPSHAAKASMLVNGYHQIHADFEKALCAASGFEAGVILGSGFNANIALIESLVRKGDELFMDEKYHASGVLATRLVDGKVTFFSHNDPDDLQSRIEMSAARRKIVAVEGIYSMDGDMLSHEIIDIADRYDAILIVDEAHSSGVVGKKLMGVLDHYNIAIRENHIKMGTLGKAYGSFGAYILASDHIIDYLLNRAKPVIYATAPSLFDTLLGHQALKYIQNNTDVLKQAIKKRRKIVRDTLGLEIPGLIVPIVIDDNFQVMQIRDRLLKEGVLVGAIRQPTVPKAIIRLIARTSVESAVLERTCHEIAAI
jgi:8-amino-7-oxononanoate synthase